jgi:ribosomal protein L11 methyltransferase
MDYIEIDFTISPIEEGGEILIAQLSEAGFESFVNTDKGFLAYIPATLFDKAKMATIPLIQDKQTYSIEYKINEIPAQNWNALWESNFEAVVIAGRCYVKAPFHPSKPEYEFELIIEPKMSFGTAHHETTSQVIQLMLDMDLKGKTLLDMGCGTGILAILAYKKGAKDIVAIDNDDWAFENTKENIERNKVVIKAMLGDATLIANMKFDVIIANINRNILLNDINAYAKSLNEKGILMMSGFYEDDLPIIKKTSEENGLKYQRHLVNNNWVAVSFFKDVKM